MLLEGRERRGTRRVAEGGQHYGGGQKEQGGALLIITHSTRILESLPVDAAHVMESGVIVKNGGPELVDTINEKGFTGLQQQ